jgi:hypothetical protein
LLLKFLVTLFTACTRISGGNSELTLASVAPTSASQTAFLQL